MFKHALPLVLIAVAGCATTPSPIEVTRFAATPDIVRAAAIPAPGGPPTLEQRMYEDAVGRALARTGFGGTDSPRYSYSVDVSRDMRRRLARSSPVTIGIGGGTGGYGGGVGLGASFGLGGQRSGDSVVTRLSLQLRDRTSGLVVWEGRAEGTSAVSDAASVDRLADALFRDFPGESGRTISVP